MILVDKKEYNDIDSLAAFLHSSEEESKSKNTISSSDYEELMNSSKSESDVDSILFSLDSKKKKKTDAAPSLADSLEDAVSEPVYDEESVDDELGEEGFGDGEIDMSGLDDEEYADDDAHYNDGATKTMAAIRSTGPSNYSEQEYEDEYDEEMTPADRAEMRREAELKRRYEKQRQTTRTFAYLLTAIFLCLIVVGASAIASKYLVDWALDLTGIGTNEFVVDIEIPDNADLDTVAAVLSENNIITSPRFFKFFTEFSDKLDEGEDEDGDGEPDSKDFIGGTYTVSSNMSYSTLVRLMRTETLIKKTITLRITEGMTAREIGLLLEENNVCYADDFEKYYKDVLNKYDFERRVKENPLKFNQLEGYLFPDTYEFYINNAMEEGKKVDTSENAEEAAMKMYSNFNDKMTRQMYKKMGEMNMTLDEVMAIASLVQREAAFAEDMKFVASVFLNRIRKSEEFPYLQSDVSIIYVENDIKPYITGTLTEKERIYNAYNTYVCTGIPSGAVCNPGLDAINAVLNAAETEYYYFCANEETGEIYYAKTIEEHEKNLLLAEIKKEEGSNS